MDEKSAVSHIVCETALFVIRFYNNCMKFQNYQRPMTFHQAAPMVR